VRALRICRSPLESRLHAAFGVSPVQSPAFLPKPIPGFGDLQLGLDGMLICQFTNFVFDGLAQTFLEFSSIEFESESHAALAAMSWIRKAYVCLEEESPP
jgi:hypothetical protein